MPRRSSDLGRHRSAFSLSSAPAVERGGDNERAASSPRLAARQPGALRVTSRRQPHRLSSRAACEVGRGGDGAGGDGVRGR
eukprot:5195325-Prymnesium_polylepis.1